MVIREIKDKNVWEGFLEKQKEKTFLQSWNWGEFQERMGNKIWRLGVFDENNLAALALASKISAKRGTFLLVQHAVGISETLVNKLKEIAKKEKASFVRMAPLLERNEENKKIFSSLGFREAPIHASAYEATWKLDLTPSNEDLLKNMRKTTRYLVRRAEKNPDISIERSDKIDDLGIYLDLNKETARKQNFTSFSDKYIKNEFEVFSKDSQILCFLGKYKGETAAGALIVFWQGIGFYHQAASDSKYANFSIPYLIAWEAIKEAKRKGCSFFDFWGYVNPKESPKHPWAGPTLFKTGFGGKPYEYIKTQDLPLSKKYWLTYIFEKLRRKKRGL